MKRVILFSSKAFNVSSLVHAVMDALLGAAGEPDIGRLYPDTDPATAGASSLKLLGEVVARLRGAGWSVMNVDTVIVAEAPQVGPLAERMKDILCPVLGVPKPALGIKGKTNEGHGAVGEGRAIACWAVALIQK